MTIGERYIWFKRAFYADKKLKALSALVQQLRERATGLVRASEGNDKGKSSTSKNGTESAYMQLAEVETQYEESRAEAVKISDEIWQVIKSLHDDELEAVLINRYLNYMTIEKAAEFMGYSVATVKRKTKEAFQKLSRNDLE